MLSILAKTFAMVFLAELGDKTQLTALALASSTPGGKWAVFAGAALALVLATLLAVLLGGALERVHGAERAIRLVSGVLFIAFGAATVWGALR